MCPPRTGLSLLAVWLLLTLPLNIALPLNCDTALYDVQARVVLEGGTAYQDIVEPNLPGALWIHMAVRSLVGWAGESMKIADLLILLAGLLLLIRWQPVSAPTHILFLLACAVFYLTRNEWCQAQRDSWLLLPTGLAVLLRLRRPPTHAWLAAGEGCCWGAAVWIKPHIVIPAVAILLTDLRHITWQRRIRETGWLITGGLLAGIPGLLWLWQSQSWDAFWTMMLDWNPEYLEAGRTRMSLTRWWQLAQRFEPWPILHLLAVPLAGHALWNHFRAHSTCSRGRSLTAACYLGWLGQSLLLQHALDYIHVPGILLALLVICQFPWTVPVVIRRSVVVTFAALALLATPAFRQERPTQWLAALTQGSTPEVRAVLGHGNFPDWKHLSRVVAFLKSQGVRDGEVTCLNVHSVHVYRETGTRPSTRYWSVTLLQDLFPSRADSILDSVLASSQKYVVTEQTEAELMADGSDTRWLKQHPVVFESGTYQVHRIAGHVSLLQ